MSSLPRIICNVSYIGASGRRHNDIIYRPLTPPILTLFICSVFSSSVASYKDARVGLLFDMMFSITCFYAIIVLV